MNPYITFRELQDGKLEYFILQKEFPHFLGKIVTYPNPKSLVNAPVAGYNLWVSFNGVINGNYYPSNISTEEMQVIFETMALWFASERIIGNGKRFDKFKIKK